MKEEPRPDSRSSVTSAESDLSAGERLLSSDHLNAGSHKSHSGVKIKSSLAAAAAATPGMKSKLSFGISRLLDEPKKQEDPDEETTDDEEDDVQDGSSSPVTRSASSHESSHHPMHSHHPLTPDAQNQHMSGHMYSYSPAFPWFGSYVGKDGIPSKSDSCAFLCMRSEERSELNPQKGCTN